MTPAQVDHFLFSLDVLVRAITVGAIAATVVALGAVIIGLVWVATKDSKS